MRNFSERIRPDKLKETALKIGNTTKTTVTKVTDFTKSTTQNAQSLLIESLHAAIPFFSTAELLNWSGGITKSAATIYDKALDANYLATHIGGCNHRIFDGGHDLISAWDAVKSASTDDTLQQEVIGYTSALWKDMTTIKGLPFFTWSKDAYGSSAEWLSDTIPYASKNWFYDLMSFDALEILSISLSAASMFYLLSKDDIARLSEILGAMGIISIISANPLMGIAAVLCTAYSYFIKKNKLDKKKLFIGASMAGMSAAIFTVLGLPVFVELGIVIVTTKLLKDRVIENDELLNFIKSKITTISNSAEIKKEAKKIKGMIPFKVAPEYKNV